MNLQDWMKSPRNEENDAVCIFLHQIKVRLERSYPDLNVDVSLTNCSSHWYISFHLTGDKDRVSLGLTYIPHALSSENPTAVMAQSTPEQIVFDFIKEMERFQ